jgi:hypothetical protein
MKLEYLAAGSPDCPLIRLYEFTPEEVGRLHAAVTALASGVTEAVEVHRLPCVEAVVGCRLKLVCRPWNQAVVRTAGPVEFECGLTAHSRGDVAGLVEPFVRGAGGFQWLGGVPGEAALLLSASGQW